MKARFANQVGTLVTLDYGDGRVLTFPTTEPTYAPWRELLEALATGAIAGIEPYDPTAQDVTQVGGVQALPRAST